MNLETENFKFFSHKDCEFFPCHKVKNPDDFNCLFCYCPLYALGDKCGGNFKYTENGIKDCSDCLIPHGRKAFDYITDHFDQIKELAQKK
ncbi:cysteine-rich small domain-containing protein [Aminicella lysinilytica]|uniref:cysteine-rich small domain-containing protein n=1 Tax=Aminicella lysinilytica TaxID=433323 RepID=UPI0026EE67AC|nr:cysteine-rich small domain-containing protein [Aminicella lysinilytica]